MRDMNMSLQLEPPRRSGQCSTQVNAAPDKGEKSAGGPQAAPSLVSRRLPPTSAPGIRPLTNGRRPCRRRTPLRPVRRRHRRHQRLRLRCRRDRQAKPRPHRQGYAGRNGIIGALREDLIDTGKESKAGHPRPAHHRGPFGSCRHKAARARGQNPAEYERLRWKCSGPQYRLLFLQRRGDPPTPAKGVPAQRIDGLSAGHHMPKTIDNDLPLTDNCPGFWPGAGMSRFRPCEALRTWSPCARPPPSSS